MERLRAYQDVIKSAGYTPLKPILIGDETELSSFNAYLVIDDQSLEPLVNYLNQPDCPTAIFAVNDWMDDEIRLSFNVNVSQTPYIRAQLVKGELENVRALTNPIYLR